MRITVSDTEANTWAQPKDVPAGCTVSRYFGENKPGRNPENYRITIDGTQARGDSILSDGCDLSISPGKLAGAA